ncbi:MAG TPA: hypothetical protein IGS31_06240, partial [Oscillatoriales cyanobacterium M4454_W2019_049]|nr:hypothetical protein [Oscillatoriales cyanobacterium M4454_W2019_049]
TPTPSSPTPEPTAEPTREPDPQPTGEPPGGNDSPSGNDPPVTDEFPPDDPGGNPGGVPDSSPPSEDAGGTSGGTGDRDVGATEGFVAYQRSGLPAGGCGGSCPDSPAQPQITPGQQFAITYAPTQRYCSGTSLVVTVVVNTEGTIEPDPDASGDACEEIARSVVSGWSFQPAETGGSPVFSVLEIDLQFL